MSVAQQPVILLTQRHRIDEDGIRLTHGRTDHHRSRSTMEGECDSFFVCGIDIIINIYCDSISPSATNSRSLPLSPVPAHLERPGYAISCPDGLAHALSEQNLRLQQIVYEHKVIA